MSRPIDPVGEAEDKVAQDSPDVLHLRSELTKLRRQLGQYRTKFGILRAALEDIYELLPPIKTPPAPKIRSKKRLEERTAVLHVSDTQGGKVTTSYNLEVMRDRLLMLADKTATITKDMRAAYKVDECRLYLGGDLVEGEKIFRHQAHLIDRSLLEQAVRAGPAVFVELILALLAIFPKVKVISVRGNHGRDSFESHPETNWDTVCAELIRATLLGSPAHPRPELEGRLEFEVADWYYVDRMPGGWGNLIVHGDQIRGGFAGHPWYGTGRRVGGWLQVIPEAWDYLFYGHFHTAAMATINYTEWRANGTTESDNEYAQSELAAAGHPTQRLCYYNKEHGLVQDHNLYLTKPGERRPMKHRFDGK